MDPLFLHAFHASHEARFISVNDAEAVAEYGRVSAEHGALQEAAGLLDLSFRGRLCLTGADRIRFLHGQVTNDIKSLGQDCGCYAAITNAKGKLQADTNIYRLEEELLLDFEPGLTRLISERLEKYLVADDVQMTDVNPLYGLLSLQGPRSEDILKPFCSVIPQQPFRFTKLSGTEWGEVYIMNQARLGGRGFDVFIPLAGLGAAAEQLYSSLKRCGGELCGWNAFEIARIEAGIPRFGAEMDESHFPQECGIEERAISYRKGCYIGQEILNRIHTLGHVNSGLCGLILASELQQLPKKGDRLLSDEKEVGRIASATTSLRLNKKIALAFVRRETNQVGRVLTLKTDETASTAQITSLPFPPQ